ncbi:hypothetical protein G4G28_16620 [Massilia sp. Dwa41.01b]|uniref:hypothetical protein n=1 Tax=unclassified Massilia TaxID=2609279 RepID=UPI0016029B46|nr:MULTISPECIES: hypothetical protein [unclassified Massilia]QNA89689.1 hypothetical protein G4G28_16620 [Massilia sp. Dwa41.01b]QNB00584.1 hypothetical protein G4G31_20205 [Massilia sp. Se16.2.3]
MPALKFVAALLLGAALLGCDRPAPPPKTADETARANLVTHVAGLQTRATRYEPRYCDEGATDEATRNCHADVMEDRGGADRKLGLTTFSCSVEPEGRCRFVASVDGEDAVPRQVAATPTCADSLHPQLTVEVPGLGGVTVSEYLSRDTADQSWVNASFTLQDPALRPTESQVTAALEHLAGRIGETCRSYRMTRSKLFLYPAGVTAGESGNWIARMEEDGERKIDLNRRLLKDERGDRYACVDAKEPGIGSTDGTKLPPVRQREIIGTWVTFGFNLTTSLERVGGKVYKVDRSAYCASGDRGELLRARSNGRYAVIGSAHGDYYQVTASGDLGVFDRAGSIDTLPKHFALYPAPAPQ